MLELINNIIYLQRKPKYKLLQSSKRTSNPQLSSSASFLRLNVLSSLN